MPLKIWSLLASASIALPSITVLFSALLLPFLAGPGRLRAAGWCWWLGTRRGAGVRGPVELAWEHPRRGAMGTLPTRCSPGASSGLRGMLPSQQPNPGTGQQPPLSPN